MRTLKQLARMGGRAESIASAGVVEILHPKGRNVVVRKKDGTTAHVSGSTPAKAVVTRSKAPRQASHRRLARMFHLRGGHLGR